ncbi:MAG: hypothetical protein ABH854_04230 [Candidatus Diapherotrites archaeon]|nr:hypothetical protein [Candidatus Micrarchaeota archaeon]MBU1939579.1 hypothetical protein [Candidatus Micrarchaeota archaeon]
MASVGSSANSNAVLVVVALIVVAALVLIVPPMFQAPDGGNGLAVPAKGASVTRSLSKTSLSEGETLKVTLSVNPGGATYYAFDEILPKGWLPVNATESGLLSTEDKGHVKVAAIQGAESTVFTYDVVVSGKGTHSFSGAYMFEGMAGEVAIAGSSAVTVE